jgi:DNA-binding response OmpR family regulator
MSKIPETKKERILIVEDEDEIASLIKYNLEREGYRTAVVSDGDEAPVAIREQRPDLALLDLMLPGLSGLDICRIVKSDEDTKSIPVIMLTAKGEESDIVAGLELGADDYITKPFSPRVLIARVRACLRRAKNMEPDATKVLTFDNLTIHSGKHIALIDNEPVDLTVTEFRILHLLARKSGWALTRYQIVDSVQGENHPVTDRSVDVQIVSLRRKLGSAGALIQTVRGVGYRFSG